MGEIILKTENSDVTSHLVMEALWTEVSRLKYSLNLAQKHLMRFEQMYKVSSQKFIDEWTAEDLPGKDMEYIEWAGEFDLSVKLQERIAALESIEYVAS